MKQAGLKKLTDRELIIVKDFIALIKQQDSAEIMEKAEAFIKAHKDKKRGGMTMEEVLSLIKDYGGLDLNHLKQSYHKDTQGGAFRGDFAEWLRGWIRLNYECTAKTAQAVSKRYL